MPNANGLAAEVVARFQNAGIAAEVDGRDRISVPVAGFDCPMTVIERAWRVPHDAFALVVLDGAGQAVVVLRLSSFANLAKK